MPSLRTQVKQPHMMEREKNKMLSIYVPTEKKILVVNKKLFMDILSHFVIKAIVLSQNMCAVIPILYILDFYFHIGIYKEESDL